MPDVRSDFDGHHERPFDSLTVEERLWWLDELIALAAECRPFLSGGQGILRSVAVRAMTDVSEQTTKAPALPERFAFAGLLLGIDDRLILLEPETAADRGGDGTSAPMMDDRSRPPRLGVHLFDAGSMPHPWACSTRGVDPAGSAPALPGAGPALLQPLVGAFVVLRFEDVGRTRIMIDAGEDHPALVVAAVGAADGAHLRLFEPTR